MAAITNLVEDGRKADKELLVFSEVLKACYYDYRNIQ